MPESDWFVGNAKAMALYLEMSESLKRRRLYWSLVISTNRLVTLYYIFLPVACKDNPFEKFVWLVCLSPARWSDFYGSSRWYGKRHKIFSRHVPEYSCLESVVGRICIFFCKGKERSRGWWSLHHKQSATKGFPRHQFTDVQIGSRSLFLA